MNEHISKQSQILRRSMEKRLGMDYFVRFDREKLNKIGGRLRQKVSFKSEINDTIYNDYRYGYKLKSHSLEMIHVPNRYKKHVKSLTRGLGILARTPQEIVFTFVVHVAAGHKKMVG